MDRLSNWKLVSLLRATPRHLGFLPYGHLSNWKLVSLPRATPRHLGLTTLRFSPKRLVFISCAFFCSWQRSSSGHYIN